MSISVRRTPSGTRRVHFGFVVRIELVREDSERFTVQTTRDDAEQLGLTNGQTVHVRPTRQTTFS